MRQLHAAAPDVGMIRGETAHLSNASARCACFACRLTVDANVAGQNERARPFARRGEPAIHEQRVETDGVLQ